MFLSRRTKSKTIPNYINEKAELGNIFNNDRGKSKNNKNLGVVNESRYVDNMEGKSGSLVDQSKLFSGQE